MNARVLLADWVLKVRWQVESRQLQDRNRAKRTWQRDYRPPCRAHESSPPFLTRHRLRPVTERNGEALGQRYFKPSGPTCTPDSCALARVLRWRMKRARRQPGESPGTCGFARQTRQFASRTGAQVFHSDFRRLGCVNPRPWPSAAALPFLCFPARETLASVPCAPARIGGSGDRAGVKLASA